MAIGIPIAYNHFGYALARTLFGIYPYMKYYIWVEGSRLMLDSIRHSNVSSIVNCYISFKIVSEWNELKCICQPLILYKKGLMKHINIRVINFILTITNISPVKCTSIALENIFSQKRGLTPLEISPRHFHFRLCKNRLQCTLLMCNMTRWSFLPSFIYEGKICPLLKWFIKILGFCQNAVGEQS